MKLLGRWSLASLMTFVIGASYYFLISVLSVGLIITLWVARRSGQNVSLNLEVPVRFELDPATPSPCYGSP
jgi:hypothetical protein